MKKPEHAHLGSFLAYLRQQSGRSLSQINLPLGTGKPIFSHMENNLVKNPSFEKVVDAATGFASTKAERDMLLSQAADIVTYKKIGRLVFDD